MEDKERLFWNFEDLKDLNVFTEEELKAVGNLIDDVLISKKDQKFLTGDKKFEFVVWSNGNITITNLNTDTMVLKPKK